jgi:hypothetical protein
MIATPSSGRRRQDLLQRLGPEGVEDDLHTHHAGSRDRGEGFRAGLDRHSVCRDPPLLHELVESVENLVAVQDARRGAVQLDEVEGVHVEVGPTTVDPCAESLQRERFRHMGIGTSTHLGRDEDRLLLVGDPLGAHPADQSLRAPVAIDIGGVEAGHSRIGCRVQSRHGVVLADRAPARAQLPAAQPDNAEVAS